ncbi:MAG: mycothiol synthase [bacterium]|nr:mycothiol synthase [bacterium]
MEIETSRLHPDDRGEVQKLIKSVEQYDDAPPLSEDKTMRLDGGLEVRERVARTADGSLIGYGQAVWHRGEREGSGHWALEVVICPEARHTSAPALLIDMLRGDVGEGSPLLWARSQYVAAAAAQSGWIVERTLLEMRRALPIEETSDEFAGFELRTFRMGVDERAWLDANNAAFAGHPENGRMRRRDLESRMARSWFDPRGFFLAWENDRLAGSCWTKIHDDGLGEIYIIGVVPGWEGRGLGKGLVLHGLNYLGNTRHLARAMLFVESANDRALGLYRELGFEAERTVAAYRYAPNA